MSDRDAFLSQITQNPDDDTARLVYADWLQEHGEDERAEFIRIQCRLEHAGRDERHADDLFLLYVARSSRIQRLSKLWLQGNGITDDGAKALASAPAAVKLEVLDLSRNAVSDAGRRLLRERFGDGVCVFDGDDRD